MIKKLIVLLAVCVCFDMVACSMSENAEGNKKNESETKTENTQNIDSEQGESDEPFFDDDLQTSTEGEATTEEDEIYEDEAGMEYVDEELDSEEENEEP